MKKIILLLLLFSTIGFSAIDECKTDVYFGNGILTKQQTAIDNSVLLRKTIIRQLGMDYFNTHIGEVDYAYNATNGMLSDSLEALLQKLGWNGLRDLLGDVHGVDLSLQVQKYEESIKNGHKVLVVAHSQGNLFAHEAYSTLPSWMQNYFEAISVASPMSADIKEGTPRIDWDNEIEGQVTMTTLSMI